MTELGCFDSEKKIRLSFRVIFLLDIYLFKQLLLEQMTQTYMSGGVAVTRCPVVTAVCLLSLLGTCHCNGIACFLPPVIAGMVLTDCVCSAVVSLPTALGLAKFDPQECNSTQPCWYCI